MARKTAKRQAMRHQNGFGSIVNLGGNRRKPYAVRITTGWEDGKQVRKYLGYYPSQAEALMALAEYHKNGVDLDLTKLTLKDVFEKWHSRIEEKTSKSVLHNHNMTRTRLGELGKKSIKEIKVDHLQDWFDAIDLKPKTKLLIKTTLHQTFEYAVQNDIINKNPVKFVKIEVTGERVGAVFTDEEIKFLWDNKDTNIDYESLLILIYTGTRIGELINMDIKEVNIKEGYAIGGSKTKAGMNRVIPFHDKILPIIKERVNKYSCIIPNKNGTPASYISFQHRFVKLMEKLKWEHRIHDTRKTGISLMHSAGIPMEVIRVIVGHSSKGITEQVYLYKNAQELVDYINKIEV